MDERAIRRAGARFGTQGIGTIRMTTPREPALLADCMLGRLAKWLRAMGLDTAYERSIADDALIARALREGRTLLTRDTGLASRRALRRAGIPVVLVASDRLDDQVAQVLAELCLAPQADQVLTRCLICNEPMRPLDPEAARGRVPDYVHRTQHRFSECPACGRIYWRATHVRGILSRLGLPIE
jgi:uncharacterized protein with PIN domain